MIDVNTLLFNNATSKEDESKIDAKSLIQILDATSRVQHLSMFAIDFDSHSIIYKSDPLLFLDESIISDKQRECMNPYWSIVSESTLTKLSMIKDHYVLPNKQLSYNDYAKHVCIIDYPILLRNHELFISQKFTPLELQEDGTVNIGLFTINYSNKKDVESTITTPSGKRFRFDFEKRQFDTYDSEIFLSVVENAILRRVQMGMTNEEIAKDLYISVNTVKTHRQHIFKKLQVKTINEALVVISNYYQLV